MGLVPAAWLGASLRVLLSFPLPSFPWQAARSNLWYARNFLMAQLSPTISVALKPKCQSGRGHAIPNRAPRREYHSLERIEGAWVEKPGWRRVNSPLAAIPKSESPAAVPRGDAARPEQLCWEGGGSFLLCVPSQAQYSVRPARPKCIAAGKRQWRRREQKPVSTAALCVRGYAVPCSLSDAPSTWCVGQGWSP